MLDTDARVNIYRKDAIQNKEDKIYTKSKKNKNR